MSTNYGNDFPGAISMDDLLTDAEKLQQQQRGEEIMTAALETWRERAVKAHPAAAPLREYLTAENEAGVMELAKDLAEKLGGSPASTATTVTGGSPALPSGGVVDEVTIAREAYKRSPTNQNYSRYLRAKHAEAGVPYPGDE